jgi:hypothetical protein
MECLGLYNKPNAEVHTGRKLTGPKEEEEEEGVEVGQAVVQLVEALTWKSGGLGFDSRCCHCNSSITILPATQ